MPGRLMSKVYLARPLTLSGASRRMTAVVMSVGFAGHLYFSGTRAAGGGAWPRPPPCPAGAPAGPGPCAGAGAACGFCGLSTSHPLGLQRGLHDPDEGAAAADVAVEPLLRLRQRR